MATARNLGFDSRDALLGTEVRGTGTTTRAILVAVICALGLAILGGAWFATSAGDGYPDRVVDWSR